RAVDWADLQSFSPRPGDAGSDDPSGAPAAAAGEVGGSVRLSVPAAELHKLRAPEVAAVLAGLGRRQRAELATMAEPGSVAAALAALDPGVRRALLADLDD